MGHHSVSWSAASKYAQKTQSSKYWVAFGQFQCNSNKFLLKIDFGWPCLLSNTYHTGVLGLFGQLKVASEFLNLILNCPQNSLKEQSFVVLIR